ncbi:uncharacterized protein [Haliotis cracherodii]|uniref:uncharacterized protein isoform X2 n=1 Tax=Haliotis cracherodii TaxID=6455 RepID=UPI0039EB9DE8
MLPPTTALYRRVCPVIRAVSHTLTTMSSLPSIRPIVISGPSGSGKSTLLNMLFEEFPNSFAFSVSHTTRKPRPGEVDGKDYHYVMRDEFHKLRADDGFLEWAEFSGNCYGTSKKSVDDISKSGKICILDVEINGVKNIKNTDLVARYIFIKPPSLEILERRLQKRGTETPESLKKRMDTVKEALDYADGNNYDSVIVNDVKEEAYSQLRETLIEDIKSLKPSN